MDSCERSVFCVKTAYSGIIDNTASISSSLINASNDLINAPANIKN